MKDNIKILVATHKPYAMPKDDMYYPIFVGATGKKDLPFAGDDSLDNISNKNYSYCELTGLYWGWKNLNYDYLGLVHYRRYFAGKEKFVVNNKTKYILGQEELVTLLNNYDVILPKKRKYLIETNESQYIHAHHRIGLDTTKEIIKEYYSDYYQAFLNVMKAREGHRFNMFIMSKDLMNQYCTWLFSILAKVEASLDISTWNKSEQRVYGYLAERLLDVWLEKNNIPYKELDYIFIEKQHLAKKIFNFIKRKVKPNVYE